jgi:hypothetical protein
MGSLVHTGLGSSSLVAHVLPYPPPPPHANSFVLGPACSNKHTHTQGGVPCVFITAGPSTKLFAPCCFYCWNYCLYLCVCLLLQDLVQSVCVCLLLQDLVQSRVRGEAMLFACVFITAGPCVLDLVQSCLHGGVVCVVVCVFITAGPSTKMFVYMGGGGYGRTCATRDDEPRPVWTSLPITQCVCVYYCRT